MNRFAFSLTASLLITAPALSANLPLAERAVQFQQQLNQMRSALGVDENHSFQAQSLTQDSLGQTHVRFQQFYQGIRIWGGEVITHTQANRAALAPTSALKQDIRVDIAPKLSKADALAVIEKDMAPRIPMAKTPVSELVIYPETERRMRPGKTSAFGNEPNAQDFVTETKGYKLAYHVHTERENPGETQHVDYLVDAHSGAIIEKWDSLQTANSTGTGNSQYSGTVQLSTNSVSSGFELRDLTRPTNGNNVVYNLNHETSGTGTIFTDADNSWGDGNNFKEDPEPTTSANGQTAAVDAAYGLQLTWDMFKHVFGRNGIDGQGTPTYARVHYDFAYDNAFYSDNCMCITYGDGTKLQTLTSLDVAAHEFSHGVCMTSAGLIYNGESGGLNEANSDIMGAMAEFYARGANGKGNVIPDTGGTWTQGEQITTPAYPLKMRFLYKPSKDGKSADAWSPTLKNLDVHYSSGPMNRAFYFLSQGATTSGETSSPYLPQGMSGIGNDKAAKIWYRALTTYMTASTDYLGARIANIQAVRDLFPVSGPEEIAVWNAFAAINVGDAWTGPDTPPSVTVSESGSKDILTFSATASDDKGVVKVEFLLDGALVGSKIAPPYSMTYDSRIEDDGPHALVAKAIDTTGQYTNASMTFTINNGQLIRNGSFEKGYGVGWSNTTGMQIGAILHETPYDGTKMAKFCGMGSQTGVSLYQSVNIPANVSSAKLSYALKIQTEETTSSSVRDTLAVQIRNTAGNILQTLATHSNLNASTSYQIHEHDASAFRGQTVQVYFVCNEDAAMATGFILDRVNLNVSGSGGGDNIAPTVSASEIGSSGNITLSANASDNVGVTKVEFYVDTMLKGTDQTAPYSITLDSKTLTNGMHTLLAKAYDKAGNVGNSAPVSFSVNNAVVDDKLPVISVSQSGTSGTISFNATATDNVGVTKVEFYVDNSLKGTDTTAPYAIDFDSRTLSDGSHSLSGRAYDAAGNVGVSSVISFSVDNSGGSSATYNEVENNGTTLRANIIPANVTKIVGYINNSVDQDYFKITMSPGQSLTVNMKGPARDYDLYLLSSNGSQIRTSANVGSTESVNYTHSGSSTVSYYIKVVSFGGGYSNSEPYTLTLVRSGGGETDKEAPNVNASVSGNSGSITLSANATDNVGVAKVEFYADGALKGTVSQAPYSMTLDSNTLSDGQHTLLAKAYDDAGNVGTSSPVTFTIDNVIVDGKPPVISVSESGNSGTITFRATASDNVGVSKVEFYVDNMLKGTDTTTPYSMELDSRTLSDGSHSLLGKAYDNEGNMGISSAVTFSIDNSGGSPTTYNEVENNGTTKLANVVANNISDIVGYIENSFDQDYFKLEIPAGQSLSVTMKGPARDYDLYLISSNGSRLRTSTNVGSSESVTYTNAGSSTANYYLKVVPFGGAYSKSEAYTLTLSR
ncbi:MAG: Ig-like domain-containing protein [Gammaproteobacteria bacterium]